MYNIKCEICDSILDIDEQLTIEDIWTSEFIFYNDDGKIIEETLNDILVYRCPNCEKLYRLSYAEWEKLARKQLSREVMLVKRKLAMRNIDPYEVDADDGMVFCGCCPGYDDAGNCFISIVNKCELRLEKLT